MPKPISTQIQNKSLVPGSTVTDALNSLLGSGGGSGGGGDMVKAIYDTDADGKVDSAETADSVQWTGVQNKPSTYPPQSHSHSQSDVTGLSTALSGKQDVLVSGTNIKTVNGSSLVGAGDVSVQTTLVSGSNIKTINSNSLLGAGNITTGDVTGPSSATDSYIAVADGATGKIIKYVPVSIDASGNVTVIGTGARFKADFSNSVVGSRMMFQSSTANSVSTVSAVPNGTATQSAFECYNNADPTNAGRATFTILPSEMRIGANINGSGSYVPMYFLTGGSFRLLLATDGTFTSLSGAIGYGAGAGGTVTQATSKSTAVTLNKPSGQITMNNAALAAGAEVFFVLNNSFIANGDTVMINGNNSANYQYRPGFPGAGAITLFVKNISAGSLSDACVINFTVTKGATS